MLRQKASMLETESSELAERLVRGQVSRADQEETTFYLKRELEACRQRDAENTAQLGELQQRLKHMEEVCVNIHFKLRMINGLFKNVTNLEILHLHKNELDNI